MWYPLETLHVCWLEPVPATCSPWCCFAWEQHSPRKHFQPLKLWVACGRGVLCWGWHVLHPSMAVTGALLGVCPMPGVCLGPPRDSSPGAVLPGSFCLSAEAPGHVFVGKLVSKSSDAGGEPVDCSKQCRHSVTAWVWLCVFGRKWQYILMGFPTFLQCSFQSVLFPRGKSTGDNTELTARRM